MLYSLAKHYKFYFRERKDARETWNITNIAIITKEGQDLTLMRNYRPISLINIDYKMFTMILEQL